MEVSENARTSQGDRSIASDGVECGIATVCRMVPESIGKESGVKGIVCESRGTCRTEKEK